MMTELDFDREVQGIQARYDAGREGADAGRDQELARLFVKAKASGRNQGWIAQRMGQSQQWVSLRLLFGRFLRFTTDRCNSFSPPKPVTEWRFRGHWQATRTGHSKDTEEDRFARVLEALQKDTSDTPKNYGNLIKKPGLRAALIDILKVGTFLDVVSIGDGLDGRFDTKQIGGGLKDLQKRPPKGYAVQARHSGRTHKYRLVPSKKQPPRPITSFDDACSMAEEALPLIKECIDILRQPEVGRQTTLAIDHLWKVRKAIERLFVSAKVE